VQDGPVPADFRAVGATQARPAPALTGARLPGLPPPPATVAENRAEWLMLWRQHKNYGTGFVSSHRYRECANCCIME
jgi:hypothetical protein